MPSRLALRSIRTTCRVLWFLLWMCPPNHSSRRLRSSEHRLVATTRATLGRLKTIEISRALSPPALCWRMTLIWFLCRRGTFSLNASPSSTCLAPSRRGSSRQATQVESRRRAKFQGFHPHWSPSVKWCQKRRDPLPRRTWSSYRKRQRK